MQVHYICQIHWGVNTDINLSTQHHIINDDIKTPHTFKFFKLADNDTWEINQ